MSELGELIQMAIDTDRMDLHTALPGRVRRYDAARQTAEIELLLKRAIRTDDDDKVLEELPILPCVPVVFPRGGGFFVSLPLQEGDSGLVVFCERAISRWRATGEVADPGLRTCHDLNGALFVPGVFPRADALEDAHATNMRIGRDGGPQIEVTATQLRLGPDATKRVAREGDTVRVTIPPGTFLVAATAGVANADPVDVDGVVTQGSDLVRAED
jgi:hypothetical protein